MNTREGKQMKISRQSTIKIAFTLLIVSTLLTVSAASAAPAAGPKKPVAKNIIVMIADGRGFNHVDATSYYVYGKASRQIYNRFPFRFAMSTYSYYCDYDPAMAWSDFEYVKSCYTDSAAAATTMATGVKTYDAAIGVDVDGNVVPNVLEFAEEKGKATGVVTSVEWTHATPAGFVAHNVSRNNYAEIGQEMVYDSAADVIMGAGNPFYNADGEMAFNKDCNEDQIPDCHEFKYVGGETTWDDLVAGTAGGDANGDGVDDPWTLIQMRAEFQSLMYGPTPSRVLGTAQVYQTLQQGRSGDGNADPYIVPLIDTVPTLEEMTKAAINILDDDPDGFFLMVEGGAAVEAVVEWIQANSNWGETLLIVTGDHETGYLTGPDSDPTWTPIVNNGAGVLPGMEWHVDSHTNSLIPLYAKGDAARMFRRYADEYDPVRGRYVDNTELAWVLFWTMDPQWDLDR
jgi:alkaline phosphatase